MNGALREMTARLAHAAPAPAPGKQKAARMAHAMAWAEGALVARQRRQKAAQRALSRQVRTQPETRGYRGTTFVPLNARLESNKEEEEPETEAVLSGGTRCRQYRGTSLIRNNPSLGPYRRLMPGAI